MSITDVIKYEGNNQTFIWKHPSEDFNTGSQLIVHETQEAIFFLNGQALDSFGPGRHELETQNLPLLNGISKITTGGVSPFHSEVYFVNLIEQMASAGEPIPRFSSWNRLMDFRSRSGRPERWLLL